MGHFTKDENCIAVYSYCFYFCIIINISPECFYIVFIISICIKSHKALKCPEALNILIYITLLFYLTKTINYSELMLFCTGLYLFKVLLFLRDAASPLQRVVSLLTPSSPALHTLATLAPLLP